MRMIQQGWDNYIQSSVRKTVFMGTEGDTPLQKISLELIRKFLTGIDKEDLLGSPSSPIGL